MLIINGAWHLDDLPEKIICEMEDRSLRQVPLAPMQIWENSNVLEPYTGIHPRKCSGAPFPEYLYAFYGFKKNSESATEVIRCRVTPTEKNDFDNWCSKNGNLSMAEGLRRLVLGAVYKK